MGVSPAENSVHDGIRRHSLRSPRRRNPRRRQLDGCEVTLISHLGIKMLDFDEILVSVKSPQIKKYLEESIKSYGVGNYRSAILAVWIAAMFDFVKKFEVLVDQCEPTAIKKWNNLEPKIKDHKNWENELIDAAEAVAMISRYEAETLRALSKTRNRYAHPSFDDVGTLFDPTPEEVRYFIRTLYDIVLSQPAQLGAFYVTRLLEAIKSPDFFSTKLYADELTLKKDLVLEKINRISPKQLPRLVKALFQALNSPSSREHELNILCFIVNLCTAEAELQIPTSMSTFWDDYISNEGLSFWAALAILDCPEYLNQLSEQSQQFIEEYLRVVFLKDKRSDKSFIKFLAYADVVPLAKSLLDDFPATIPLDEIIRQSGHYSDLLGAKFAEIFGEAILNETRQVLKTRNGYKVNPALSALRRCGIWNMVDSLSLIEQKDFANELILSLNSNNYETMGLLSFSNRSDIPIKWIKMLLEQWDENFRTPSWVQDKLLNYLEYYLGLVERYTTELGHCSLLENALQIVISQTIAKAETPKQLSERSEWYEKAGGGSEWYEKAAVGEVSRALEKIKKLSSNEELWMFWKRLLSEHQHLITATPLETMI